MLHTPSMPPIAYAPCCLLHRLSSSIAGQQAQPSRFDVWRSVNDAAEEDYLRHGITGPPFRSGPAAYSRSSRLHGISRGAGAASSPLKAICVQLACNTASIYR